MNLHELASFVEQKFTYPVTTDHVIAQAGHVAVDAPNHEDSETIESILARLGSETYVSGDELFTTIIGSVTDDYIGRKFYDDRGGDPAESWSVVNEKNRSF